MFWTLHSKFTLFIRVQVAIWYKCHRVIQQWQTSKYTAMPTGNYDPRCLPVRVLFLLLFFSLPLLALAKASHPTNILIKSGKTALRDMICPGGADNFFLPEAKTGEISPHYRAVPEKMW